MTTEATNVRDEFVRRLVDRLATSSPVPRMCSRLANARAAAQRSLTPDEYDAAMLYAHQLSPGGLPWEAGT
jgi:hypothetical protein